MLQWNPEKSKFQTHRRPAGYRPVKRTSDERRSAFFNWFSKLPKDAQKSVLNSEWVKRKLPGWTGFGTEGSGAGVSGFGCCGMGDAGPVVEAAASRWMNAGDCKKFSDMAQTYTRLSQKKDKSKQTRANAATYAAGCRAYHEECIARNASQVPSGGFCVNAQGVSVPCAEQPESVPEEGSTSPQGGTVYRVLSTNQRFYIDATTGQRIYQNSDGTWGSSTTIPVVPAAPVVPAGLAPTGQVAPAGQPIYYNPATGQSLYFGPNGQPAYYNPNTGVFDIVAGLLPTPTLPQPVTPVPESPDPEITASTEPGWLSTKNLLIVGAVAAIGAYAYWKKRKR